MINALAILSRFQVPPWCLQVPLIEDLGSKGNDKNRGFAADISASPLTNETHSTFPRKQAVETLKILPASEAPAHYCAFTQS